MPFEKVRASTTEWRCTEWIWERFNGQVCNTVNPIALLDCSSCHQRRMEFSKALRGGKVVGVFHKDEHHVLYQFKQDDEDRKAAGDEKKEGEDKADEKA
jgi:hypothetical protein